MKFTTGLKPEKTTAWRERIKADLQRQLDRGGTLYGYRQDGQYVARTSSGDRITN